MKFMEWCSSVYGIAEFSEGYSTHIFLPAIPGGILFVNPELAGYLAYHIAPEADPEVKGLVIPRAQFDALMNSLRTRYEEEFREDSFEHWVRSFFIKFGVDISLQMDHKELNFIEVPLHNEQHARYLITALQAFFIGFGFDSVGGKKTLHFSNKLIPYLRRAYEQNQFSIIGINKDTQLQNLLAFNNARNQELLSPAFATAHDLGRKFYSARVKDSTISVIDAIHAYDMSLKLYTNLYCNELSNEEFSDLHYISILLEGLGRDSIFIRALQDLYRSHSALSNDCSLSELPDELGAKILKMITQNTSISLYGNPEIGTPGFFHNVTSCVRNNELVWHNEDRDNFYIFRIIAVGMLSDGKVAGINDIPLYNVYYKVQHEAVSDGTSLIIVNETKITRLIPFQNLEPLDINPEIHPNEYQLAMESTIMHLIIAERQVALYGKSEPVEIVLGEVNEPSSRINESRRLNRIINLLSGVEHSEAISYLRPCMLKQEVNVIRNNVVTNQSRHVNATMLSPMLPLKNFVFSLLRTSLATLHLHFMQYHNAGQCQQAVAEKISSLQQPKPQPQPQQEATPPLTPAYVITPPPVRRRSSITSPIGYSPIHWVNAESPTPQRQFPGTLFSDSPKRVRQGIIRPTAKKACYQTVEGMVRKTGIINITETSQSIEITFKKDKAADFVKNMKKSLPAEASIESSGYKVILSPLLFKAYCRSLGLDSEELLKYLKTREASTVVREPSKRQKSKVRHVVDDNETGNEEDNESIDNSNASLSL